MMRSVFSYFSLVEHPPLNLDERDALKKEECKKAQLLFERIFLNSSRIRSSLFDLERDIEHNGFNYYKHALKLDMTNQLLQESEKALDLYLRLEQEGLRYKKGFIKYYRDLRCAAVLRAREHRVIENSEEIKLKLDKQSARISAHQKTISSAFPFFSLESFIKDDVTEFEPTSFVERESDFCDLSFNMKKLRNQNIECAKTTGGFAYPFNLINKEGQVHHIFLSGILEGGDQRYQVVKNKISEKLKSNFESILSGTVKDTSLLKVLECDRALTDRVIWNVLKITCVEVSEELRLEYPVEEGFSIAFSILIDEKDLWHANIGHCRSFLIRGKKVVPLGDDMRLNCVFSSDLSEKSLDGLVKHSGYKQLPYVKSAAKRQLFTRVIGGEISVNNLISSPRLLGNGTVGLKGFVSARPKIRKVSFNKGDILCHGSGKLWKLISCQELGSIIYKNKQNLSLESLKQGILNFLSFNFPAEVSFPDPGLVLLKGNDESLKFQRLPVSENLLLEDVL